MAQFNAEQKRLMAERTQRRATRIKEQRPISFLAPDSEIKGTGIRVQDARDGKFVGAVIPHDLQRQWLQGTGPAAKPNSPVKANLRNVAYALLSGADGWMFDGEDALGQITTMSLDNQRSLKLAIARDPLFPGGRRTGGRRNERLGPATSSAARSSPTGAASSTLPPRSSAPAACTSTTATSASTASRSRPRSST